MPRKARSVSGIALTRAAPLVLVLLVGTSRAIAAPSAPGQQAPYAIGHVTLVLTDPSRNPDGSTPVRTAGGSVYPGLPDTPALTFTGSLSAHEVGEGALGIASGRTHAVDFRNVEPIDFAALRDGPPVMLL
jgi:hypothetical protein